MTALLVVFVLWRFLRSGNKARYLRNRYLHRALSRSLRRIP